MSYYEVLKVDRNASQLEIRQAYLELARSHHPDLNPGDACAHVHFKRIVRAYEILGDAHHRQAYDRDPWRFELTPSGAAVYPLHDRSQVDLWRDQCRGSFRPRILQRRRTSLSYARRFAVAVSCIVGLILINRPDDPSTRSTRPRVPPRPTWRQPGLPRVLAESENRLPHVGSATEVPSEPEFGLTGAVDVSLAHADDSPAPTSDEEATEISSIDAFEEDVRERWHLLSAGDISSLALSDHQTVLTPPFTSPPDSQGIEAHEPLNMPVQNSSSRETDLSSSVSRLRFGYPYQSEVVELSITDTNRSLPRDVTVDSAQIGQPLENRWQYRTPPRDTERHSFSTRHHRLNPPHWSSTGPMQSSALTTESSHAYRAIPRAAPEYGAYTPTPSEAPSVGSASRMGLPIAPSGSMIGRGLIRAAQRPDALISRGVPPVQPHLRRGVPSTFVGQAVPSVPATSGINRSAYDAPAGYIGESSSGYVEP